MALKKIIIEVEEGQTRCLECPYSICRDAFIDCEKYNLSTMRILKIENQ